MSATGELRILLLEDIAEEAEIVQRELQKAGLSFAVLRVQTRQAFSDALRQFAPDLILADSKLPGFDGRRALELANTRSPGIPVIMVTGELGDEAAVELLIAGARDYVLKDRLARLGPAVRRVLREEEDRRNRERLEDALRDATDEERRRLAQELHDGLGQELTGLAMLADGLVNQAKRTGAAVPPELARLADIARHAIKSCRDIAHGLSPLGGTPGGISDALRELAARLGGPPGPRISLALDLQAPVAISREASEHLYRIAQEAVANAIRHSGASALEVRLEVDPLVTRLCVFDDGCGAVPNPGESAGLGLRTMQHRAEIIGARLSIGARSGGGTALMCEVPQPVQSAQR
jgi:signal transduction histidine kinase